MLILIVRRGLFANFDCSAGIVAIFYCSAVGRWVTRANMYNVDLGTNKKKQCHMRFHFSPFLLMGWFQKVLTLSYLTLPYDFDQNVEPNHKVKLAYV